MKILFRTMIPAHRALLFLFVFGTYAGAQVFSAADHISIARWRGDAVPYDGFYMLGEQYGIYTTFFIDGRQLDDPTYEPFSSYTPISQPAYCGGTWADWKWMAYKGH